MNLARVPEEGMQPRRPRAAITIQEQATVIFATPPLPLVILFMMVHYMRTLIDYLTRLGV
jgi:hypothetical protein